MRLNFPVIVYLLFILTSTYSCIPFKRIIYFQDEKGKPVADTVFTNQDYEFKVAPYDLLNVQIDGIEDQSMAAFKPAANMGGLGRPYDQGTFVNKFGQIELPYAGKIKVSGLTLMQAADTIRSRLLLYVVDSSLIYVHVKTLSFPVTVLGEVARPGIYQADNEFVTLTEILAKAGDLTIFSNRTNVRVIRSNRETKETNTYRIDLTKGELIRPVISRLQPNDVIYVEPLRRKQIDTARPIISIASTLLSVTALILTIRNRL